MRITNDQLLAIAARLMASGIDVADVRDAKTNTPTTLASLIDALNAAGIGVSLAGRNHRRPGERRLPPPPPPNRSYGGGFFRMGETEASKEIRAFWHHLMATWPDLSPRGQRIQKAKFNAMAVALHGD